jgi:hypothetical protein
MGAAAAQAALIVHARVTAVHFIADPNGGMPHMNATLGSVEFGKGCAVAPLVITQSGGPVAQPGGKGALVEQENEDLVLPGDEVLLLLDQPGAAREYAPVYGAGVQFISGGKMAGHSAQRYGLEGAAFASVWNTVVNPNAAANAYPVRSDSN